MNLKVICLDSNQFLLDETQQGLLQLQKIQQVRVTVLNERLFDSKT
jgi:hypothetical protein